MAAIMIDIDDLKERVYRMLRNIEDGNYKNFQYGVCTGCLSAENTAALDDFMKTLLDESK